MNSKVLGTLLLVLFLVSTCVMNKLTTVAPESTATELPLSSELCVGTYAGHNYNLELDERFMVTDKDSVTTITCARDRLKVEVVMFTATPEPVEMSQPIIVPGSRWHLEYYSGATQEMLDWIFSDLDPPNWSEFPNVDNTAVGFSAADGLEYGMAESSFCQQVETCDVVVPAMHYRIISGDYNIGFDACEEAEGQGCGVMLVNVGNVTASFEDEHVDAGFTVWGRYWNGDALPTAIWAGLSHVGNNMMNMDSNLNPSPIVNAGANCSSPGGCESVRLTFVIVSGNELLMKGVTIVER